MAERRRVGDREVEVLPAGSRRRTLALLSCPDCEEGYEVLEQVLMEGGVDLFTLRCRGCAQEREVFFEVERDPGGDEAPLRTPPAWD